ncbi:YciI family protein [Bradyrhizobium erythrophlei]|uniref:YciI family protein n=1 Tax=Bradyrhizobium erythrophlei TaxID=1437360 RepID=UPI0035E5F858
MTEQPIQPSAPSQAAFLLRLNPPRATFPGDMSATEAELMQKHFPYWAELLEARTAVIYGPVNDPKGTWGVAIIRVADQDAAWAVAAHDPVIQAGAGFRYNVSAMSQLLVGA